MKKHGLKSFSDLGINFVEQNENVIHNAIEEDNGFWEYMKTRSHSDKIRYPSAEGNLMDNMNLTWNLGHFPNLILAARDDGLEFDGITAPYLYRGFPKSIFPWQVEDLDMYSLHYLHWGAPTKWYSIVLPYARRFEKLNSLLFGASCDSHLRHKTSVISPTILDIFDIKYMEVNIKKYRVKNQQKN